MMDDLEVHVTRREAIEAAIADAEIGDCIMICLGGHEACGPDPTGCEACFRYEVKAGITADDVDKMAQPN